MSTRFYLFGLMLGAWSLSGCSKDDTAQTARPETVGTITRTFELEDPSTPDSRTVVNDDGTIGFTASENMTSHIWAVVNGAKIKSANGKTATRKAGTPSTVTITHDAVTDATLYSYVFVSPNTNGAKIDETEFDTLTVHLAESQTPTAASFDPRQDVLVSRAVEAAAPGSDNKAQLEAVLFKRLFTFFRMTIDRSVVTEIPAGDQIRAVSIEALDPTVTLSGDATVPVTDDPALCVPSFTSTSNRIAADYGAGAEFTGDEFNVWMVVNPARFTGMRIKIRTTTKVITQTLDTFQCELLANTVNTMNFRFVNKTGIVTTIEDYTDYYADGVTIDGVTYNGQSAGAQLLAAGADLRPADGGVLFISSVNPPSAGQGITKDLVVIGRYSDEPVAVALKRYWGLRNAGGKLMFKNLDLDFLQLSDNYCFNLTTSGSQIGGMGTICFEDCILRLPAQKTLLTLYGALSSQCMGRLIFKNCKISIEAPTNAYYFINLDNSKADETGVNDPLTEIRFDNNIIYSKGSSQNSSLVSTVGNITSSRPGTPNLDLVFTNNTLVDIGYYQGLFKMGNALKSVTAEKNILCHAGKDTAIIGVSADYAAVSGDTAPLQSGDNLTFGKKWRLNSLTNTTLTLPGNNEYANAASAPLTTCDTQSGTFVRSDEAAAGNYGSSLE